MLKLIYGGAVQPTVLDLVVEALVVVVVRVLVLRVVDEAAVGVAKHWKNQEF